MASRGNPCLAPRLALWGRLSGGAAFRTRRRVDVILQFLARLEIGDLLGRDFHFRAGLRVAAGASTALAGAKAAEAADLDLVVGLQRLDDTFENRFNHGFRLFTRQLG